MKPEQVTEELPTQNPHANTNAVTDKYPAQNPYGGAGRHAAAEERPARHSRPRTDRVAQRRDLGDRSLPRRLLLAGRVLALGKARRRGARRPQPRTFLLAVRVWGWSRCRIRARLGEAQFARPRMAGSLMRPLRSSLLIVRLPGLSRCKTRGRWLMSVLPTHRVLASTQSRTRGPKTTPPMTVPNVGRAASGANSPEHWPRAW
ncbi:hypothetical protein [Kibdelosporangium philippinense]|uniref:hypothetical protein n=1 Tax=Kibdelosporangium philippinense TaxID=211113 RepID=UPI003609628F